MLNFENETATCMECMWSGDAEELRIIVKENDINKQDKSLYEIPCCPECGSEFIEIT